MGLREGVRDLLTLIDGSVASLESPPNQAPRQFAAAGLVRCCALLRGICVLEDAGLGPVTGILERQHWETWLISLHVLLRGDEAMTELAEDDIYWKRLLAEKLELGIAYHEEWESKGAKLNYRQLADNLKALLMRAGEPGDPDGAKGYDATYRTQSLFSVHANLATIGWYMLHGEKTWAVRPHPPPPFPKPTQTPALHTTHLASYVFKAFGLSTDTLDPIWEKLIEGEPGIDPHVM